MAMNGVYISRFAMISAAVAMLICVTQVTLSSAGSNKESLHELGIGHVDVIGTRLINEHHEIHDYPESSDSSDKKHGSSDSSDSDYHNPIYDYADHSKADYSKFGDKDSHKDSHDSSDDKSHS